MHKNIHITADEAKVLYKLLECVEGDTYCSRIKKKLANLMLEQTIEVIDVDALWDLH